MKTPFFATMQGRLVPPEENRFQCFPRSAWRDEFSLAAKAGLNGIEWIFDEYGEDVNPLTTDSGIAEMLSLSHRTASLCDQSVLIFSWTGRSCAQASCNESN